MSQRFLFPFASPGTAICPIGAGEEGDEAPWGREECGAYPHPLTLKVLLGKLLSPAIGSSVSGPCLGLAELLSLRDPLCALVPNAACNRAVRATSPFTLNSSISTSPIFYPKDTGLPHPLLPFFIEEHNKVVGA